MSGCVERLLEAHEDLRRAFVGHRDGRPEGVVVNHFAAVLNHARWAERNGDDPFEVVVRGLLGLNLELETHVYAELQRAMTTVRGPAPPAP